jgi:hypothetical protein
MCFELYVGTTKAIPRRVWNKDTPDLNVAALTERQAPVVRHFNNPEVQYIGSTSGCGCDFPHLMLQNGDWPILEDSEIDPEQVASDRLNMEGLVHLLQEKGENTVELYGVWNGDFSEPKAREEISAKEILDPSFHFKEQGFYKVRL